MDDEKYPLIIGGLVIALIIIGSLFLNTEQDDKNYRKAFKEANSVIEEAHYDIEQAQSGKDDASYSELHERLDSIDLPETVSEPK